MSGRAKWAESSEVVDLRNSVSPCVQLLSVRHSAVWVAGSTPVSLPGRASLLQQHSQLILPAEGQICPRNYFNHTLYFFSFPSSSSFNIFFVDLFRIWSYCRSSTYRVLSPAAWVSTVHLVQKCRIFIFICLFFFSHHKSVLICLYSDQWNN